MTNPYWFDAANVQRLLDDKGCIAAVRAAMTALSADPRAVPLRSITELGGGKLFGIMPGLVAGAPGFGAKLVGVFPDPARPGRSRHHGTVLLLDGTSGELVAAADAETITRIRTAAASAVATDCLARADASRLAIYGGGVQARAHIRAIAAVRPLTWVGIWGRDAEASARFAGEMAAETGLPCEAVADPASLAGMSDILCTVTGSPEPVLRGAWVPRGAHVNAVGSSYAGPVEVDTELVAASRYFVDFRPSALAAAAEFLRARAEGVVDDAHILGEIGEVLGGVCAGRLAAADITFYKSLGHVAQDFAALQYILYRAGNEAATPDCDRRFAVPGR